MNFFAQLIKVPVLARECIYYEAYTLEKRSGTTSPILPILLVGLFDSPLIMGLALLVEPAFFSESVLRDIYPSSISSIYNLAWFFFVGMLEFLYYRATGNDIKIIKKIGKFDATKLIKVKAAALFYATFAFLGGSCLVYYIW